MISKFKTLFFIFWILLNPVISVGQVPEYYSEIDFTKSSNEIKNQLHELISQDIITYPYTSVSTDTWDIMQLAEQDPNNSENIILIYSGDSQDFYYRDGTGNYSRYENGNGTHNNSWNREHVYPKSLFTLDLDYDDEAYTDIHNLKAAKRRDNAERGVRVFGFKDDSVLNGYGVTRTGAYYPGDKFIGDVARIIMYSQIRYPNITKAENVGEGFLINDIPEIFLLWNELDPPDKFEINRNEIIYGFQGNRNPFVDNPYLATKIWGGPPALDEWGIFIPYEIDVFPTSSIDFIEVSRESYDEIIEFEIFDMSGKNVSNGKFDQNIDISFLEKGTYILKIIFDNYFITKKILKL